MKNKVIKNPIQATPSAGNSTNPLKLESKPTLQADPWVVHEAFRETLCVECGAPIEGGDYFLIEQGTRHVCLDCAGLDRLVFLPSGNTTLTPRAMKQCRCMRSGNVAALRISSQAVNGLMVAPRCTPAASRIWEIRSFLQIRELIMWSPALSSVPMKIEGKRTLKNRKARTV